MTVADLLSCAHCGEAVHCAATGWVHTETLVARCWAGRAYFALPDDEICEHGDLKGVSADQAARLDDEGRLAAAALAGVRPPSDAAWDETVAMLRRHEQTTAEWAATVGVPRLLAGGAA